MKKVKKFLFGLSVAIIFVLNLVLSFNNEGKIGVKESSAVAEKYEDKFKSIKLLTLEFEICCELDDTDGCWRDIWVKC